MYLELPIIYINGGFNMNYLEVCDESVDQFLDAYMEMVIAHPSIGYIYEKNGDFVFSDTERNEKEVYKLDFEYNYGDNWISALMSSIYKKQPKQHLDFMLKCLNMTKEDFIQKFNYGEDLDTEQDIQDFKNHHCHLDAYKIILERPESHKMIIDEYKCQFKSDSSHRNFARRVIERYMAYLMNMHG
jgi:hypothetical protein